MDHSALLVFGMSPVKARLMMTGIELKIFNLLKAFCFAEDVARYIGAHPENTRVGVWKNRSLTI